MDSLREVLAHLEQCAGRFDSATVLRAQVVVEELFTNSVSYGGRTNEASVTIALGVSESGGELRLRYEDEFAPFDPFADLDAIEHKILQEQPLAHRAVGGLGRLLAGRLADEVHYAREQNRNCIDLRFVPRSVNAMK